MNHPVVISVKPDGTARAVFHPNAAPTELWAHGQVLANQAGALVAPANPQLRRAFLWLRRTFGRRGRVAAWTRRWRCAWIVLLPGGHCRLPGVFADRGAAIDAEIAWLLRHE